MQTNFFNQSTTDELLAYLDEHQLALIDVDPFIKSLPHIAIKAVGCLILEAMRQAGLSHHSHLLRFVNGVFQVHPNYGLYEILVESYQFQSLQQHLTELVQWMVD